MNSDPATNTDNAALWLSGLLQMADSYYPTGAYAHSFGLEGMVQLDVVRDAETLGRFIRNTVWPALRQTELPLTTHAWLALDPKTLDWEKVGELCVLSHALKTSREIRQASENIGRQRTELLSTLRRHPLVEAFLLRAKTNSWPMSSQVATALEGRVMGAPLEAVLSAVVYAAISGQIAVAMKLIRLGQNAAQKLLTEFLTLAPDAISHAKAVPLSEIGWFNPWLDIASARHETSDFRLFIS